MATRLPLSDKTNVKLFSKYAVAVVIPHKTSAKRCRSEHIFESDSNKRRKGPSPRPTKPVVHQTATKLVGEANESLEQEYIPAWKRLGLRLMSPNESTAERNSLSVFVSKEHDSKRSNSPQYISEDKKGSDSHASSIIRKQQSEPIMPSANTRSGIGVNLKLPPLSNIDDIFTDMVVKALGLGFTEAVSKLNGRIINVATMCSGTDAPLIAIQLISKALEKAGKNHLRIKHHFSAEIEVVKQGYIERNFQPNILFRDVREFIPDDATTATTAYGAEASIPDNIDILAVGWVCRDASSLNNHPKSLEDNGESGDTYRAARAYARRFRPTVVLLENVENPDKFWRDIKTDWAEIGYEFNWKRCDTKNYYLPQTRSRVYMIAVDRKQFKRGVAKAMGDQWDDLMQKLQRQCSSPYEAFLSDIPIERGIGSNNQTSSFFESSWTLCKLRYDQIRSTERLGPRHPITKWSKTGTINPPDFANHEWYHSRSTRVYDCIDIAHLQGVQNDYDSLYKMAIWDVSQNVDRFRTKVGNFGRLSCITPRGCLFASNRQTELTGSELLVLQGMPYDKLLFTNETQKELQDLAGNAMSTTVIGASIIAALTGIAKSTTVSGTSIAGALVSSVESTQPPQAQETQSQNTTGMSRFIRTKTLEMEFPKVPGPTFAENLILDVKELVRGAKLTSLLCSCEAYRPFSKLDVLLCVDCGHTACVWCAGNPKHAYAETIQRGQWTQSYEEFERVWKARLPVRLTLNDIPDFGTLADRSNFSGDNWEAIISQIRNANIESRLFTLVGFRRMDNLWKVTYSSPLASLLLLIGTSVEWRLYIKCSPLIAGDSPVRKVFELPLFRGSVTCSLLGVKWKILIPNTCVRTIQVKATGERVKSYRNRLGLLDFQTETAPTILEIKGSSKETETVTGSYRLLRHCGTAMESLYKSDANGLFLFLDSTLDGPPENDAFVFSRECRRMPYGSARISVGKLDTGWRPWYIEAEDYFEVNMTILESWAHVKMTLQEAPITTEVKILNPTLVSSVPDCSNMVTFVDVQLGESLPIQNFSDYSWALQQVKSLDNFKEWQDLGVQDLPDTCDCAPPFPQKLWSVGEDGTVTAREDRKAAASFERIMKTQPPTINVHPSVVAGQTRVEIGVKILALTHRARVRLSALGPTAFAWRIVPEHVDQSMEPFRDFHLRDNSHDTPYDGPLTLQYKLTDGQMRSLGWMKSQEKGKPLTVTEVEESVHLGLGWRAEARAQATVSVRGCLLADYPSFGKTATTIGLIQSEIEGQGYESLLASMDQLHKPPSFFNSAATLIVCPPHIASQWRCELRKFLTGADFEKYNVLLIEDFSKLRSLAFETISASLVLIVSWSVFAEDGYISELAQFSAIPDPASKKGQAFDAWSDYVASILSDRLEEFRGLDYSEFKKSTQRALEERIAHSDFKASVPIKVQHGRSYQSFSAMQEASTKKSTKKAQQKPPKYRANDSSSRQTPLLHLFRFNRIVVDEFHYVYDKNCDNHLVYALVKLIKARNRWLLSGTPGLIKFSDINNMASLLGARLGSDALDCGFARGNLEKTNAERFMTQIEVRTQQWHEARHRRAQDFLDEFVRQNEPSLSHIACSESLRPVELDMVHHAVYLELAQHLSGTQGMQVKRIKKTGSDRADRLHQSLNNASNAEEALLKAATFFETGVDGSGIEKLIRTRQDQYHETEAELLDLMTGFETIDKSSTVNDHYISFKRDIRSSTYIGDQDANTRVQRLLKKVDSTGPVSSLRLPRVFNEASEKDLKGLLSQLRTLLQELVSRIRSERFIASIRDTLQEISQENNQSLRCDSPFCTTNVEFSQLFLIAHCGHRACASCLKNRTDDESCVDVGCNSMVKTTNLINMSFLISPENESLQSSFGRKLDAVVSLIKTIPEDDQGLVFVPNEQMINDLEKVFNHHRISYLSVKKNRSSAKIIDAFKRNKGHRRGKKILILHTMGESAAGVNLTNANHVIFVSPPSAKSQNEFDSAMSQAIARACRYGQEKRVQIYHFSALRTIDVDILERRHKRLDALQASDSPVQTPQITLHKKQRTQLIKNTTGGMALVPISWVKNDVARREMGLEEPVKHFSSLIELPEIFEHEHDS